MSTGGKLWGGRFQGPLDAEFEAFNRSLRFDCRLLHQDIAGSKAWARALGAAGVLTDEDVSRLQIALDALDQELADDPGPLAASSAEDVHSFVETALAAKVGDLAKRLHTGRSRNDQVATDLKLFLRDACKDVLSGLRDLIGEFVELAGRETRTPIPGYTHLQRAQPITVGHHALAYAEMLWRDASRIEDAAKRMDSCPLGSGALAGTAWPIDREQLADDLQFSAGPTRNSLDAVSARDHVIEVVGACATIMVHLSRFAEDWIFYATQEAGFLRLSDQVSTGSSLMPQKRNPDALELIRGKSGRVIGHLMGLLTCVKGLPLAYNKDLQEDKEALFGALDTTVACLRVAATCVNGAVFDGERGATACARGHLDATDLADLLVTAGVPFRDAHERVGECVKIAESLGCTLAELPREKREEWLPELGEDLSTALTPESVLARRDRLGGTAPDRVAEAIESWRARLDG